MEGLRLDLCVQLAVLVDQRGVDHHVVRQVGDEGLGHVVLAVHTLPRARRLRRVGTVLLGSEAKLNFVLQRHKKDGRKGFI